MTSVYAELHPSYSSPPRMWGRGQGEGVRRQMRMPVRNCGAAGPVIKDVICGTAPSPRPLPHLRGGEEDVRDAAFSTKGKEKV
jgi:hypothetical protein